MLAEYLLGGNPRRGHKRRRHNPTGFGMHTLTNPMPLLVDAGSGLAGIAAPIIVGNLVTSFVGPSVPMINQPGIVGSAIRAGIRVGAAMLLDPVIYRIPMLDHGAYRVGAAIGIGGSLLMDLLGRPLILGPGDSALSFQYLFGGFSPAAIAAGQGSYFRRQMTGQGSYFRRQMTGVQGPEMGNINALVPVPRVGTRGMGNGLNMSPKTVDLFSPF